MKRWRNFFWITAGLLALIAMAGSITPYAVAQIRAALVRDVDSPVRGERFAEPFAANFSTGSFTSFLTVTPTIPAGKKFVVQSVSLHVYLTDGQSPMEARATLSNNFGLWIDMEFQAQSSSSNPQRHFTGNRDFNATLLPGETIQIFLFRNGNDGSSSLNFYSGTVAGYLVDQNL